MKIIPNLAGQTYQNHFEIVDSFVIRIWNDRVEFDDEKSRYWQARFRMFSDAELHDIYG